eukprot:gnl/TRDRNA2_/TRDRNA2_54427_c0_seq1.p1 gnl/TRDRNA2_/TRDRNA2_54427_c0~~gnl/TRDRNA2_/TRDRNA2_54427_c0_seq1.p1  ORF type:complete len:499 (+),score=127.32 gnl/TRDRNA2_/TRDRNA2_54427_c0_seq1:71-1567(+)
MAPFGAAAASLFGLLVFSQTAAEVAEGPMTFGASQRRDSASSLTGRPASPEAGVVMAKHSFEKTLTYDDTLGDWLSSAGTMALRDRLQLVPPVPDRHGCFFSKQAIRTSNFEASFAFRLLSQGRGRSNSHFTFWISAENFTASFSEQAIISAKNWTKGLEDQGLTFAGNKPKFKGLAMIFLSEPRPSVTGFWNDGSAVRQLFVDVPVDEGSKAANAQSKTLDWRAVKNTNQLVGGKVRIDKGHAIGSVQVANGPWTHVFNLPISASILEDAFIGFTAFSGAEIFDEVNIQRVEVKNFDQSRFGEDESDVLGAKTGEWLKMLESEKRFIDQKSQAEAVKKLTELLTDHVETYTSQGMKVRRDLLELENRVGSLNAKLEQFVHQSESYSADINNMDRQYFKDHVVGLKKLFSQDKDAHWKRLDEVHEKARQIKDRGGDSMSLETQRKWQQAAAEAQNLQIQVAQGSRNTNYMLLAIILCVAGIGYVFLQRMWYYEKKHFI